MDVSYQPKRQVQIEIAHYQQEFIQATHANQEEVAMYWHRVLEVASKVAYSHSRLGKLHDLQELPLPLCWKHGSESTQAAMKYIFRSLEAMHAHNIPQAQEQAALAESIKKAAALQDYWTTCLHQEAMDFYSFEEGEALQHALSYRSKAAQAMQEADCVLAQQWAEAACLAQEAATKITKSNSLAIQNTNLPLSLSWQLTAFWCYRASTQRALTAEALAQGREDLTKKAQRLACIAEHASTYRSKAARALQESKKDSSYYWTMGAYWAGNAFYYQQQESPTWGTLSQQALQTSSAYAHAAKTSHLCFPFKFMTCYRLHQASRREQQLQEKIVFLVNEMEKRIV